MRPLPCNGDRAEIGAVRTRQFVSVWQYVKSSVTWAEEIAEAMKEIGSRMVPDGSGHILVVDYETRAV